MRPISGNTEYIYYNMCTTRMIFKYIHIISRNASAHVWRSRSLPKYSEICDRDMIPSIWDDVPLKMEQNISVDKMTRLNSSLSMFPHRNKGLQTTPNLKYTGGSIIFERQW